MFALIGIIAITAVYAQNTSSQNTGLSFKIKVSKSSIILGEPVQMETELLNTGKESVKVQRVVPDLFRLFVSSDGEKYVVFVTEKSKTSCGFIRFVPLDSRQSDNTNLTVLWQGRPDYSNLDPKRAKWYQDRDKETMIVTDYAFPEPGVYFVKFKTKLQNENGEEVEIESDAAQIVVSEPSGEDLEVWKKIQGKREIALLMQGTLSNNPDSNAWLASEVEQILGKYPNTTYSSYLRKGLEKLYAGMKKLDE